MCNTCGCGYVMTPDMAQAAMKGAMGLGIAEEERYPNGMSEQYISKEAQRMHERTESSYEAAREASPFK